MKDRKPRNQAASVRKRLQSLSRKTGEDFQLLLTRYAVERLLYRLSRSSDGNRFLLKGAMLCDYPFLQGSGFTLELPPSLLFSDASSTTQAGIEP